MQKTLKRIAVILLALVATVCVAVSLTACNSATDYTVTVEYPDHTAVNGTTDGKPQYGNETTMSVQLCVVSSDGKTGQCFTPVNLGADGKATIEAPEYTLKEGEKFKIQVNAVPAGYQCDSARTYYDSNNYVTKPGNYKITLVKE